MNRSNFKSKFSNVTEYYSNTNKELKAAVTGFKFNGSMVERDARGSTGRGNGVKSLITAAAAGGGGDGACIVECLVGTIK